VALSPGIYDFYARLADSFEFAERHEPAGRPTGGWCGACRLVRRDQIPWNAAIVAMSWKIAPGPAGRVHWRAEVRAQRSPVAAYLLAEFAEQAHCRPGC